MKIVVNATQLTPGKLEDGVCPSSIQDSEDTTRESPIITKSTYSSKTLKDISDGENESAFAVITHTSDLFLCEIEATILILSNL